MIFPQLAQYQDFSVFFLRLTIGIIFVYHALPKLKNSRSMAQGMGMPNMAMGVIVLGLVEAVSGIGLILGVYTQLVALLLALVMVGATAMKTMKWHVPFAAMDKTGWEFDFILLAANLAILFIGGGSIGILR